jgi:hypothetical protein
VGQHDHSCRRHGICAGRFARLKNVVCESEWSSGIDLVGVYYLTMAGPLDRAAAGVPVTVRARILPAQAPSRWQRD